MRAVIFDLDGTLIDSAPDIHAAANRVLADEGLAPLSFEAVRGFIGKGLPHLVARLLEASGEAPDGPRHRRMLGRFEASYETAVGLTVIYPGVIAALDALAATGHALGICTNKPLAPARAVLRHLGLDARFGAVLGGDSLPQRKPDPAPLRATAAALDATAVVYVGDSEVDAATAAAAGLPFALFTEGYRKVPVAELPHDRAFADFAALPGIVDALLTGRR
jgi:phosphoglycolate phosphatase